MVIIGKTNFVQTEQRMWMWFCLHAEIPTFQNEETNPKGLSVVCSKVAPSYQKLNQKKKEKSIWYRSSGRWFQMLEMLNIKIMIFLFLFEIFFQRKLSVLNQLVSDYSFCIFKNNRKIV